MNGKQNQNQNQSGRSEEHTSELQSPCNFVCRLLLEKKKQLSAYLLATKHPYTSMVAKVKGFVPLYRAKAVTWSQRLMIRFFVLHYSRPSSWPVMIP